MGQKFSLGIARCHLFDLVDLLFVCFVVDVDDDDDRIDQCNNDSKRKTRRKRMLLIRFVFLSFPLSLRVPMLFS